MADNRKFQYKCSNGHELASEKSLDKCLVVVKGSPCKGTLARFGRGSKTETKETKT